MGMDGVDLTFTKEALIAIADQGPGRKTGARGLRSILEEVMLDVMYDLPLTTPPKAWAAGLANSTALSAMLPATPPLFARARRQAAACRR